MPQKKEKQRIAPKNEIISIWLEGLLIFPKQCFSNVGNQYSKNFRDYNRNYNWNKCIYSKCKSNLQILQIKYMQIINTITYIIKRCILNSYLFGL